MLHLHNCLECKRVQAAFTKSDEEPNGIKLVVTSYHIKGYGSACRVHPRAVETGPCSIPRHHATVYGSDQRPELIPRDLSHIDTTYVVA
jgi:hypothetical protein